MVSHGTPTDPKFNDDPDSLRLRLNNDEDTEGHFMAMVTEDPTASEGDGLRNAPAAGDEDTEGHLKSLATSDAEAANAPEGIRARSLDSGEDDTEGHRIAAV